MNTPPRLNTALQPLIENDLACVGCGYNLRMLPHDGRCPECATPIIDTVNAGMLSYADPAWRQRTARGLRFLSWVLAAYALLFMLSLMLSLGMSFVGYSALAFGWIVMSYFGYATGVALLIGIWRITHPEPQAIRLGYGPRLTARIAVLLLFIAILVGTAVYSWAIAVNGLQDPFNPQSSGTASALTIAQGAYWIQSLSWAVVKLALLALLWRWFRRGQRPRYRRLVSTVFWIFLASEIISQSNLVARYVFAYAVNPSATWLNWAWQICMWISHAGLLLSIPLLIIILIAARAAAATMLRSPTPDSDTSNPDYRTI